MNMAKKATKENMCMNSDKKAWKDNMFKRHHCHSGGAIYGLGFIGAAVYYIVTAKGFWMGVLGFLKALVWPAFVVFHLMKFLGM
jgi:uncharacterized protein YjlB